jgi:hypothetical protein
MKEKAFWGLNGPLKKNSKKLKFKDVCPFHNSILRFRKNNNKKQSFVGKKNCTVVHYLQIVFGNFFTGK